MDTLEHRSTSPLRPKASLVKIGGSLGIAGTCIAIGVFLLALFGLDAVFMFAPLAALFSMIGLILTIVGGVLHKHSGDEDTQPIAALFVCLMGLAAASLEWMMRPR
jgi:hypothetical protein